MVRLINHLDLACKRTPPVVRRHEISVVALLPVREAQSLPKAHSTLLAALPSTGMLAKVGAADAMIAAPLNRMRIENVDKTILRHSKFCGAYIADRRMSERRMSR